MDVRDVILIKQLGTAQALYLHVLAADPKRDLLAQIKHSQDIERIRQRSHFRQKTPIANITTIS